MQHRRRLALVVLCATALFLSACGARQNQKAIMNAHWEGLYNAAPADAAYTVGFHVDSEGQMQQAATTILNTAFVPAFGDAFHVLMQQSELSNHAVTAFIRNNMEWMIAEVDDVPNAMTQLAEHYRDRVDLSETRVGQRPVLSFTPEGASKKDWRVQITGVGSYIIVRDGPIADDTSFGAALAKLSRGWPGVGRYAQTDVGKRQRARAGGQKLTTWINIRTAGFNAQQKYFAQNDLESPLFALSRGAPDTSAACQKANERLNELIPSVNMISYKDADGLKHSHTLVRLSEQGRENARTLVSGSPDTASFSDVALASVGLSFDYGTFFKNLQASPDIANCYGLAGVAGHIAGLQRDLGSRIAFNARTVTGSGAIVIEKINLKGFIPTVDFGLVIESPNAAALFTRLVRALSKRGKSKPLATTSTPVVEVTLQSMPVRLRIRQGDDRVVITSAGADDAAVAKLMNLPLHGLQTDAIDVHVNGPRLRETIQDVEQYVDDMQMDDSRVDGLVELLKKWKHGYRAQLTLTDHGLRFDADELGD